MTRHEQGPQARTPPPPFHLAAVAAVVSVLLVASILTWLPVGELLPMTVQSQVRHAQGVAPQGWAFFTKSPRGQVAKAYLRDDDGVWRVAERGPNAQWKWAFGLNRESRLTEFDVQTALAEADEMWREECATGQTDEQCLSAATVREVASVGRDLRLCGDVGIVRREPVPWAYREFSKRSAGEVIRLEVSCEEIA